ncbi:MAG: nucleotidyltransferase domain-containing protein [Candidatus Aminicenantes bacterium]|nr:nucleotidyltransferase domain-containing protein [Candidatus Aminicenantes bacterium]
MQKNNSTSAAPQRLEQIKDICQQHQIALAYLFGSQKDLAYQILLGQKIEMTDPLADIDLGLVFKSHAAFALSPHLPRHILYADLYNKLSELFLPYPLDLVFLQESHSVFQFEAIKGICVYAISEAFKDDYEMMILRRAADFKYTLETFAREALEQF